jgi:hypothetical protein
VVGHLQVEKLVNDDLSPEGGRFYQEVRIEGQPTLGRATSPLRLHGAYVYLSWFHVYLLRPGVNLRLKDFYGYGFLQRNEIICVNLVQDEALLSNMSRSLTKLTILLGSESLRDL